MMDRLGAFIASLWAAVCFSAQEPKGYMAKEDVAEVTHWLSNHKMYRMATDGDCRCDEDIVELRKGQGAAWPPQPNYHPHYAKGDFDGNGYRDFAVVVTPRNRKSDPQIVVFLRGEKNTKVVVRRVSRKSLVNFGLFLARRQSGVDRLIAGAFGSEGDDVLENSSPNEKR